MQYYANIMKILCKVFFDRDECNNMLTKGRNFSGDFGALVSVQAGGGEVSTRALTFLAFYCSSDEEALFAGDE